MSSTIRDGAVCQQWKIHHFVQHDENTQTHTHRTLLSSRCLQTTLHIPPDTASANATKPEHSLFLRVFVGLFESIHVCIVNFGLHPGSVPGVWEKQGERAVFLFISNLCSGSLQSISIKELTVFTWLPPL